MVANSNNILEREFVNMISLYLLVYDFLMRIFMFLVYV